MPCKGLPLLKQHLSPLRSTTGLLFAIIRHTESFPNDIPEQQMKAKG